MQRTFINDLFQSTLVVSVAALFAVALISEFTATVDQAEPAAQVASTEQVVRA
ncbi:hypothetical protein [Chitinimonas sp. BJYL2]|uniref:hypothetical protein n=1 Tax=Chitinimonas sp. BJYL2 TaxID=2976696 RepID=UPI0022B50DC0|nr:hypothetical protein [Chitinimonas sp. BJYL2]